MRPASEPYSSYQYQASLRSRLVAFVLTTAIVLLLLYMLMQLGLFTPLAKLIQQPPMTMINLKPGAQTAPARHPTPTKGKQAKKAPAGAKPVPVTKPVPQPKSPKPVPWNVTPLSHSEMAQADISAMPSHAPSAASGTGAAAAGDGAGAGGNQASGSGEGPGGAQLYNAAWYRKPTDAEMDTYMPRTGVQPGAWGEIACKTIPEYRVEDCRELGESPGSGMSRAMRQAAWQFRILPPRVGGKPLIGAWVRIRYDIVARGSEGSDGDGR